MRVCKPYTEKKILILPNKTTNLRNARPDDLHLITCLYLDLHASPYP